MRILVTGADGFVGRHLSRTLRGLGDEVLQAHGPHAATPFALDVTDGEAVRRTIAEARPEGVIHLAGFSSVGKSHKDPGAAFAVNAQGALNLLDALKRERPDCRVLLVGSGEMYGAVPPRQRADEQFELSPLSPYAAAKVAAEAVGFQFHRSYGLPVVSARPFNHLGQGQDPSFVVPSFARQIAAIQKGQSKPVLQVGDLTPVRDFSHVLDVVDAYRLLLERGEAGAAYNVCSGDGLSIRALLDEMLMVAGVSAEIQVDPGRLRPAELPSLVGNPAKIRALGWVAKHTRQQALAEVLAEAAAAQS